MKWTVLYYKYELLGESHGILPEKFDTTLFEFKMARREDPCNRPLD